MFIFLLLTSVPVNRLYDQYIFLDYNSLEDLGLNKCCLNLSIQESVSTEENDGPKVQTLGVPKPSSLLHQWPSKGSLNHLRLDNFWDLIEVTGRGYTHSCGCSVPKQTCTGLSSPGQDTDNVCGQFPLREAHLPCGIQRFHQALSDRHAEYAHGSPQSPAPQKLSDTVWSIQCGGNNVIFWKCTPILHD